MVRPLVIGSAAGLQMLKYGAIAPVKLRLEGARDWRSQGGDSVELKSLASGESSNTNDDGGAPETHRWWP